MHNFELNLSRSRQLSEISEKSDDGVVDGSGGSDGGVNANSTDSTNNNMEVIFLGPNGNPNLKDVKRESTQQNRFPNKYNSCKTLQRKLELKVERAKRNYSQHNRHEVITDAKTNSTLIPINRLPIPGHQTLPLVEYKSDHSSEDEEFSSPFFPSKPKAIRRVDLSDTFSIQEMTIETDDSDAESGDSQNLELLPPNARTKFIDKILNCLCCSPSYGS